MSHEYDDIIHLPHPVSTKHPQMSARDRAAQFAPFAALNGHGDAIKETARVTDEFREADESETIELDQKMNLLLAHTEEQPIITVTYFKPDLKKEGGSIENITDHLTKYQEYEQELILRGGVKIPLRSILHIEGEIFDLRLESETNNP